MRKLNSFGVEGLVVFGVMALAWAVLEVARQLLVPALALVLTLLGLRPGGAAGIQHGAGDETMNLCQNPSDQLGVQDGYEPVALSMKTSRTAIAALVAVAATSMPISAIAKVLAEGKPSGGYYWQKVEQSNGTRYLCRSTSEGKIQKAAKCEAARAAKPK